VSVANQLEYEAWNGESGRRWIANAERHDRVLRPVAEALLNGSLLQAGEAVLDLGCGCGATTLGAARAVGPTGSVVGVDISEVMLNVATRRIAETGPANVALLAADAQTHPFEPGRYDIAISRFGTMFFHDPAAAFANIAGALRPGGRLYIATWQPLVANDWLTIPGAALLDYGRIPDVEHGGPGMFAQSDPAAVAAVLLSAGFTRITSQAKAVPLPLGRDPGEATSYVIDSGVGRAWLATVPDDLQQAALKAVHDALGEHQSADGVVLDGGILLTSAVRA
jgi:SAM-dependent methyltransferase